MYVSEDTFVHLRQAADERRLRELEYRRIARERGADTSSSAGRGLRQLAQRIRRMGHPAPRPLTHP